MTIGSAVSWLVAQGLIHDLVSACVMLPMFKLIAAHPIKRIERLLGDTREIVNELNMREIGKDVRALEQKVKPTDN